MASMREVGCIPSANNFSDSTKCKNSKKKSKKLKREKGDKDKPRTKHPKSPKDDMGCCESNIFTQLPVIKKKKKKKKTHLKLNEEFPLTRRKKIKSPMQHRRTKDMDILELDCNVLPSIEQELMQLTAGKHHESLTSEDKVRKKKRVIFNLFPEEIKPKRQTSQNPFAVSDAIKTQSSFTDKHPCFYTMCCGGESHSKTQFEENVESQGTSEDINSQDLFITQKSFSDSYVDISSSTCTDDATAVPAYRHSTSCRSSSPEKPSCKQTVEASTQTNNFFTPALATSVRLHIQNTGSMCVEEPVDLSLPNRSRQKHGLHQSNSKPAKDLGQPDLDIGQPELKITDVTSSDDSDATSKGKADLTQLKVVQTRLNESFFFKLKGEGDLAKPTSPLMKLTRSDEKKSKK